ncbi:hypothetical protein AJ80_07675 [Polytolypa hystricis UAMH7299]|uniref:Uncharacterized protein n=1 Tax=Polytolypa hystricis (strain UAMH7299) TaxID=1447883 RepID=A0A2B7XKG2_POLH7|nr:hypothetical protein AJ80_07675 [Polytolypa hystricis UAMH7299]
MQIISFSHEAISTWKQCVETGSADENLAQRATSLSAFTAQLKESLETTPKPLTKEENELLEVSKQCLATSTQLNEELNKISKRFTEKPLGLFRGAVRMFRKGDRIPKLRKTMESYQEVLESGLLIKLCTQDEAKDIQNREEFSELNNTLQVFIKLYAEGQTRISELVMGVDKIGELVTAEFAKARKDQAREGVLRGLKFEGMNERRNIISEAHDGTFRWVFYDDQEASGECVDIDDPLASRSGVVRYDEGFTDNTSRPWDSFPDWLKSADGLYWISGKAGSGKSTLMKYLVGNHQTQLNLATWCPNPRIISHFFWISGHGMQRSIKGFLCSSLFQIISNNANLFDILIAKFPQILLKDSPSDWDVAELEKITLYALAEHTGATCIFLDGLDEISEAGSAFQLLNLLDKLKDMRMVKLCVSSRPEVRFARTLSKYPKLCVQDLTYQDIFKYTTDFLRPLISLTTDEVSSIYLKNFASTLCRKSDGVFLWAHLALRSLQNGITNNDDLKELYHRLDILPKGLHELFNDMWFRLGEDQSIYQIAAAKYFNFVVESQWRREAFDFEYSLSTFHLMAALDTSVQKELLNNGISLDMGALRSKCKLTINHVLTRCAGILEHHSLRGYFSTARPNVITPFSRQAVSFIHRSASDFLLGTEEGQNILKHDKSTKEDRHASLLRASLVEFQVNAIHSPMGIEHQILFLLDFLHDAGQVGKRLRHLPIRQVLHTTRHVYTNAPHRGLSQKKPDLYFLLAESCLLDIVITMLQASREPISARDMSYLLICVISGSLRHGGLESAFAEITWLLDHGADVNLRGLSIRELLRLPSTYSAPHSILMRLVMDLHKFPGSTTLALIGILCDRGAFLQEESAIFYFYASSHNELSETHTIWPCVGWPIWRRMENQVENQVVYKANLSFLLRLTLMSIHTAKISGNQSKQWPPGDIAKELLDRTRVGVPDPPEILGYINSREYQHEAVFRKFTRSKDRALITRSLVKHLWLSARQESVTSISDLWELFHTTSKYCEKKFLSQLEDSLVKSGLLVPWEDCWNEFSSFNSIMADQPF